MSCIKMVQIQKKEQREVLTLADIVCCVHAHQNLVCWAPE